MNYTTQDGALKIEVKDERVLLTKTATGETKDVTDDLLDANAGETHTVSAADFENFEQEFLTHYFPAPAPTRIPIEELARRGLDFEQALAQNIEVEL